MTQLAVTLHSVHTLGEHVLAAARHAATGRIGLTVVDDGFATPPFGPGDTVVGVIDGQLVVRERGQERRTTLTTLRDAGDFVGIRPGAPVDVYTPATPLDLDKPLSIDDEALRQLVGWYSTCATALQQLTEALSGEQPSPITLWPEHFDVATRIGEVNYGALGGDSTVAEPYAYVGPTGESVPTDPSEFWNQPFGAAKTWHELSTVDDVLAFFRDGRRYT